MSSAGSPVEGARGRFDASAVRIAVLVARFHSEITERLAAGALACLMEHGASKGHIDVIHVPGAWELPQAAARVVALGRHDAVVTLGCVIRGETPHFDYVCSQASSGLGAVARGARIPVLFGVLTTDTHEQAAARAADGPSNKGYETAQAALEMIDVYRSLECP